MSIESMPGNERVVIEFLLINKGRVALNHIGLVNSLANPSGRGRAPVEIRSVDQVHTEDAHKKADVIINGKGVSIKQEGSSFAYNRIQRASLLEVFPVIGLENVEKILERLDRLIDQFHSGKLDSRDRHWLEAFTETEFRSLLEYLMMKGSIESGVSEDPAEYILSAPKAQIKATNIECLTFSEYFEKNKDAFVVSIRRVWRGQASDSEHRRAVGLCSKPGNARWCYTSISGSPRNGWRLDFPVSSRMTAYILFLTLK
jgi:hypothetical protein